MTSRLPGSAIILAGGESRRMGRDKTEMPWRHATLLEHVVKQTGSVFDDVLVVFGAASKKVTGARVLQDKKIGVGPLGGLISGLEAMAYPWAFVVACDMPFVRARLARFLWSFAGGNWQAIIPWALDRPQPLCGCYHRSALLPARVSFESGERSLQGLLALLRVRWVREFEMRPLDPTLRSFANLNTPKDYERALSR